MITHTEIVMAAKDAASISNIEPDEIHTFVSGFIVGAIFAQEPRKRERKIKVEPKGNNRSTPTSNVDFDAHR